MNEIKNEIVKLIGAVTFGGSTLALLTWIFKSAFGSMPNWLYYTCLITSAYACAQGAECASIAFDGIHKYKKEVKKKEIEEIATKVVEILKNEKIEV